MAKAEKYLRPEVIRQVARLDLRAKFIVEGFLSGLHASPFHGFSVEFSEHRTYAHGDDLKYIDWNVFAKTGKYYIKKFEAAYSDLAVRYKVTLIPFLLEGVGGNDRFMQRDGLHPNAEGALKIEALVMKTLESLLR